MNEPASKETVFQEGFIERFETTSCVVYTLGKPLNGRFLYSSIGKIYASSTNDISNRNLLLESLAYECKVAGVLNVAIPRVDRFNAHITTMPSLKNETINGITFYGATEENFFSDGVLLYKNQGAIIVTGDCPTIILYTDDVKDPIIATHAGRNSLHTTLGNIHCNKYESVVYAGVDLLIKHGIIRQNIKVRITAGIEKEYFTHPLDNCKYGEQNKKLVEYFAKLGAADLNDKYGKIDLKKAIMAQLIRMGVPEENITTDERLWSHRTGDKYRNMVLVLHT